MFVWPVGPAMEYFDLVIAAEPRVGAAEGRALAAALRAAAEAGYRTALAPLRMALATTSARYRPEIRQLIESRTVSWLGADTPAAARLGLIWHPAPLQPDSTFRGRVRAERAILRLDRPTDRIDPALMQRASHLFECRPLLAFADPLCRAQLAQPTDIVADWPAAFPPNGIRPRSSAAVRVLGRHAGGGNDAMPPAGGVRRAVYPIDGSVEVRFAERALSLVGADPDSSHWRLARPELDDPQAWLAEIHAYVMATGAGWRPWLPAALIEALASGVLLVVPPALKPLLGDAALYSTPELVPDCLAEIDPPLRRTLGAAAAELHASRFSPEALVARLREEIGEPRRALSARPRPRRTKRQTRILFLSPNGIGMGHLTRLLAVARRLPADIEPVFLSMSQAVGVVETFGFMGEYFPYHEHTGERAEDWNRALRARLDETIAFYDARCVLFDGNVPYQGLIDARGDHPSRPFVWLRRAMWRGDAGRATIDRARYFDLVVEPGEYAAERDPGITVGRRNEAVKVPPIILFDPEELPSRAEARTALGLDPDTTAVLVQLGSRNNFDYAEVDRIICEVLGSRPEIELVFLEWLIGEQEPDLPTHARRLKAYPTARYLRAFDLVVSACGYNSFHELLATGTPTLFVPNENPMMDAQEVRAGWADAQRLAIGIRRHEVYRLAWALDELLRPESRQAVEAASATLPRCDGARVVAGLIEELVRGWPASDSTGRSGLRHPLAGAAMPAPRAPRGMPVPVADRS
ncbi:MAG: glycosyltransferase [Geminicoccaceae bacterium]